MLFSMGKPSAPSPQPSPARGEGARIRQFPQGSDIMTQPLQPLPVGINSLRMVIESGMTYVDKTRYAYELARLPGRYFLSRPRRFGKSLFLDTLQELFEGSEALFRGLYIHDRWDWSRRHPVLRLDFAGGVLQSREELDASIHELLARNRRRLGLAG